MTNKLLSFFALTFLICFCASAQSPTAPALGFNAFLQNDATLITNESEGGIAIGGNLTVAGGYQVNIHSNSTFKVSNVPIGLFVGGQVNLSSGSLQVNGTSYLKIGNCASSNIKVWYVDNNNAASNMYVTASNASYASGSNININAHNNSWGTAVSASNNPVCDANTASEISFSSAFTTMKATAVSLAACSTSGKILSNPNGNVFGSTINSVLTSGQVKITLASGTNVLNVSGTDLTNANNITFNNSPDASHILVINVDAPGTYNWNVWNQSGIGGSNAPYIIYNFYNTTTLNIPSGATVEGTVFAPNAVITKNSSSNIEGQVIGQSFTQNGGELHHYPFTPSVTGCAVACAATSSITNASICAGGSYTFNGSTYSTAGSYSALLKNAGGCDSTANLVLTVKANSTSSNTLSICPSALPYTWNGLTFNAAGTQTAHLLNAAGCDSAATLVLSLKATSTSANTLSVCLSQLPYSWNGLTFNAAGTQTAHLTNAAGCDSAATLVLTIKANSTSATSASICEGGSYTFNGSTYTSAGTYIAHLTNAAGCDSAASLVLTVNPKPNAGSDAVVCSTESVKFYNSVGWHIGGWSPLSTNPSGASFTQIDVLNSVATYTGASAGVYSYVLNNSITGCSDTMNVTVKAATSSTTTISVCGSSLPYTWNGTSYNAAGSYTIHLTNAVNCDSAATLVLAVKETSTSSTVVSVCSKSLPYVWNGTSYNTTGSYTIYLKNAAGCDSAATLVLTVSSSSTSTTTKTICSNELPYSWNGLSFIAAGAQTANLTNAAGCDSSATLVLSVTPSPVVDAIVGTDTICATTTTTLTETTVGGTWASSDNSVATVDATGVVTAIADGKTNITYTVTNGGCSATATLPFVVSCDTGTVTSGATGGLESKPIGAAIGTRNFNLYKNGKNGVVKYSAEELIATPKKGSYTTFGTTVSNLSSVMPYKVNSAYTAYDKSASVTDLTSITNAIEVRTIDFTLNNSPKAVAFATKTIGGIYSHTKPICDRLKGAQLLNVENIQIASLPFIRYTILQADGTKEYAISFSAGQKAGRNTYSLQSKWLMTDYIGEDTMVNYQLWAATPTDATTMVKEILSRLQTTMPVVELTTGNDLPKAYVSAANRIGTNLNLTINNKTANTSGYFELTQHATENSGSSNKVIVPFTISANAKSTVSIPVSDSYDANISVVFNNAKADMLYMADGIWGTSGDNNTSVAQFNISNNSSRVVINDEYALLRDVKANVTTPSYVSIYKYLKGGASAVNLTGYKSFKFTASTSAEGLNMKVTITKESVSNWKSQYTYYITGLQDGQTYQIGASDFKSTDASLPASIDLSDVTSVVYNIENPTGQSINFTAGITNAAFSKVDVAYEKTLQAKTVGISPNPNNGAFKVSFASPSATQLQLSIFDNTGRLVSSSSVSAIVGQNNTSINLTQGLKKGVYYVSLQGSGVNYNTQKIVINGK